MISIFDPTKENILKVVGIPYDLAIYMQRLSHEMKSLEGVLVDILTEPASGNTEPLYDVEDYQYYMPRYLEAHAAFFYAMDIITKTEGKEFEDVKDLITEVSLVDTTVTFKTKGGAHEGSL